MTDIVWSIIFLQIVLGGFDSLFHHELMERLAWRCSQAIELRLHGARILVYAVILTGLGWSKSHGAAAAALLILIVAELILTLWDFVEEDRTRLLSASERVLHTLLTLNYGVILAVLVPLLVASAALPTTVSSAYYWPWSWLCTVAARRDGGIWLARSRRRSAHGAHR